MSLLLREERSRIRAVPIDGQPQRSAWYQENGKYPECMDEAVVQGDEGCNKKIYEGVL